MKNGFWIGAAAGLLLLNAGMLGWAVQRGGSILGPEEKVAISAGLRSDMIEVKRPEPEPVIAQTPKESVLINPRETEAKLAQAVENAEQVINDQIPPEPQCLEWGPLLPDQLQRVRDSLAEFTGDLIEFQRQIPIGYIVILPQDLVATGMGLDRLAQLGVTDTFYMAAPGPLQGSISLGLFRDKERAERHLDEMAAKGVRGAEVKERLGPVRSFFRLTGSPAQATLVRNAYRLGPRGELNDCQPS